MTDKKSLSNILYIQCIWMEVKKRKKRLQGVSVFAKNLNSHLMYIEYSFYVFWLINANNLPITQKYYLLN